MSTFQKYNKISHKKTSENEQFCNLNALMYPTPQCSYIKNFLKSISSKSVYKTH